MKSTEELSAVRRYRWGHVCGIIVILFGLLIACIFASALAISRTGGALFGEMTSDIGLPAGILGIAAGIGLIVLGDQVIKKQRYAIRIMAVLCAAGTLYMLLIFMISLFQDISLAPIWTATFLFLNTLYFRRRWHSDSIQ